MKLTTGQIRKIIKEEIETAVTQAAPVKKKNFGYTPFSTHDAEFQSIERRELSSLLVKLINKYGRSEAKELVSDAFSAAISSAKIQGEEIEANRRAVKTHMDQVRASEKGKKKGPVGNLIGW